MEEKEVRDSVYAECPKHKGQPEIACVECRIEAKKKERREVVWEHRSNGGRFMTTYDPDKSYEDNEHHIVVAENVSYEDGKVLCDLKQDATIKSFLDDLPSELRDPETDAFIAAMIKNDGK